jgi:hypothetical protein
MHMRHGKERNVSTSTSIFLVRILAANLIYFNVNYRAQHVFHIKVGKIRRGRQACDIIVLVNYNAYVFLQYVLCRQSPISMCV